MSSSVVGCTSGSVPECEPCASRKGPAGDALGLLERRVDGGPGGQQAGKGVMEEAPTLRLLGLHRPPGCSDRVGQGQAMQAWVRAVQRQRARPGR